MKNVSFQEKNDLNSLVFNTLGQKKLNFLAIFWAKIKNYLKKIFK